MYKSQKQKLLNVPQEAISSMLLIGHCVCFVKGVGGRQLGMFQLWNYQKKNLFVRVRLHNAC